jgi:hypothetical protein
MLYKMSDKLVFDLAQEVEGSPTVFIRKDWINILDNQNQNYNNNQSIVDTSQLSNSNKYMSYREAYFLIPLTLTLQQTAVDASGFKPSSVPSDYSVGLKNWFGQIIHSFTLDYNGTTVIQQTPYVNMWNSFKLMTSLSYSDIATQGCTIGFYPDDCQTWTWTPSPAQATPFVLTTQSAFGQGVSNNTDVITAVGAKNIASQFNQYTSSSGNLGFLKRTSWINYDACLTTDSTVLPFSVQTYPTAYSELLTSAECTQLWKSHVFRKIDASASVKGTLQIGVTATVYLKHVHSFFNMCPLLKGVFMKMTMNLNNSSTAFETGWDANAIGSQRLPFLACTGVSNPIGGVNVGMISACAPNALRGVGLTTGLIGGGASDGYVQIFGSTGTAGLAVLDNGFSSVTTLGPPTSSTAPVTIEGNLEATQIMSFVNSTLTYKNGGSNLLPANGANNIRGFRYNVSVGSRCLDAQITGAEDSGMSKSVYLYIPSYAFNPVFEQAYLSSPIKQIKYTDIYQYQVLNVGAGGNFNNLLTNGISNIKSVLILPMFSSASAAAPASTGTYNTASSTVQLSTNSGFLSGIPVFQSPFDTVGTGTTSPLAIIKNFNIQVSGQNAIYNMEKYPFEQFNNQLYGANAVNGGLTDGITSGLIDRQAFDMNYTYYYVDVSRMLPVEQQVPKSIQILGTNSSAKAIDLYCFIEYGVEISIDSLTGARV